MENNRLRSQFWMGLIAIAAGVVLLLDHLGMVNAYQIFRLWPAILIVVGVAGLIQNDGCCRGKMVGNGVLVLVGVVLLLEKLHYVSWAQSWPIILIGLGLLLVYESLRPKQFEVPSVGSLHPHSVFSGVEKNIIERDFREGSAEAVFGSVKMDLTQAEMAEDKAVFTVNCVFGSVEIRAPYNWSVVTEVNAVFGSCENKTRPPAPTADTKTLIIRGDVVFGSVEVRN